MKILAIEKDVPGVGPDRFQPLLRAEAQRVWELSQAGIIRESYFRGDCSSAVLILECSGPGEAREIIDTLPLVREGLITFELIPLRPYPGFSRLFAAET